MQTPQTTVKATTQKGSVDLVKRCFERGDRFSRFNEGFIKVNPKRPEISLVNIQDVLSSFFAEGAPEFGSPFLVSVEFFLHGMSELGQAPESVLNTSGKAA